jgi:hypothetical protein
LQSGPFKGENDYSVSINLSLNEELLNFREYEFSLRFGVEKDPGMQGYHRLKGKVTNDFLVIGKWQKHRREQFM